MAIATAVTSLPMAPAQVFAKETKAAVYEPDAKEGAIQKELDKFDEKKSHSLKLAGKAFLADISELQSNYFDPDVEWEDDELTKKTKEINFVFNPTYAMCERDAAESQYYIGKLEEKLENEYGIKNKTDFEKLKTITEMMGKTYEYRVTPVVKGDYGSPETGSAWYLLSRKNGCCQGWAAISKMLCEHYEIPCVNVEGFVENGIDGKGRIANWNMGHQWDEVCLDGKWYTFDALWGLPASGKIDSRMTLGLDTVFGDAKLDNGKDTAYIKDMRLNPPTIEKEDYQEGTLNGEKRLPGERLFSLHGEYRYTYYYTQLNDFEKQVYRQLFSAFEKKMASTNAFDGKAFKIRLNCGKKKEKTANAKNAYEKCKGGAMATEVSKDKKNVHILAKVKIGGKKLSVAKVRKGAFKSHKKLERVTFDSAKAAKSVKNIKKAFAKCKKLEKVVVKHSKKSKSKLMVRVPGAKKKVLVRYN